MKVMIWSDVRCPFCYIGKRKFEKALEEFSNPDDIEVEWKSFQLDPNLETQTDIDFYEYFAKIKGVAMEEALGMFKHVSDVANEVGLNFDFSKSIVANSFQAHRLIQFAKYKGLGNEMEEELFRINFIAGKNIDDKQTLVEAGVSVGLLRDELEDILNTDAFSDDVKLDELAAQQIGVRGVPFFVFDEKYSVSGAQSPAIFLKTLEKAWAERSDAVGS
jgi:predicted DsbA family dithiol-disulfide isomerase